MPDPNAPDAAIGKALRLVRIYHDMKAKNVAAAMGFSCSQISSVEAGKKSPSLKLIYAYSKYFGIEVSSIWLFADFIKSETKPDALARLIKFIEIITEDAGNA